MKVLDGRPVRLLLGHLYIWSHDSMSIFYFPHLSPCSMNNQQGVSVSPCTAGTNNLAVDGRFIFLTFLSPRRNLLNKQTKTVSLLQMYFTFADGSGVHMFLI